MRSYEVARGGWCWKILPEVGGSQLAEISAVNDDTEWKRG